MLEELKTAPKKTVGLKQTRKALVDGAAASVFVARDAEARVRQPVLALCEETGVPVFWADTMLELGRVCGIEVGAAVAAVLR
ncbi:MAG: ribosomal L7Ae/L30e/S12e/Gadd45 family protein [Oscillospiraceae bacterium]|nr:ribosomal L7Ae/L30e/S12e/Gadd45 family protein [Oscillospiraceae bacterium]